jgi:hypothetical protein
VSLAPVPSEQAGGGASCAHCSAPLAPDQRYCLACGQPASPVRLAFLDVLQAEAQPYAGGQGPGFSLPHGYAPVIEPASGASAGMLRRYSGLFGLLSVLLLAIVVGLLVGHWVTQSKAPSGSQVIKVEGLGSAPATSAAASTTPTTAATTPAASKSSASAKSEEEKEKAAAKAEEKAEEKTPAKAPEAKKISSTAVTKLEKSHGKTHEKELNKISTAPIEVK